MLTSVNISSTFRYRHFLYSIYQRILIHVIANVHNIIQLGFLFTSIVIKSVSSQVVVSAQAARDLLMKSRFQLCNLYPQIVACLGLGT